MAEATVTVHDFDDVTISVDLVEFLDEIGEIDPELQERLNAELDFYVQTHAEYYGESWYNLTAEKDSDSGKVLRLALAATLGVDSDDPYPLYAFTTSNWDNLLSQDFGGTVWGTSKGEFLTVESDGLWLKQRVELRPIDCSEPVWVIATASSHARLGCTVCSFHLDTTCDRLDWAELTRPDPQSSEDPCEGLFCPRCGHPVGVGQLT